MWLAYQNSGTTETKQDNMDIETDIASLLTHFCHV